MIYTEQQIKYISIKRKLNFDFVQKVLGQDMMTVMQFVNLTGLTKNVIYSRTYASSRYNKPRFPILEAAYPYPDKTTSGPMFIVHNDNAKKTILNG